MTNARTNLEIARHILENGFGNDPDALDEVVPDTFIEHQFGMSGTREGLKQAIKSLRGAFPDMKYRLINSAENGDLVWVNYEATGTHTNPFMGRPGTGKTFAITVIDIMRIKNGKIVEHWGVPDRFALAQQLGF